MFPSTDMKEEVVVVVAAAVVAVAAADGVVLLSVAARRDANSDWGSDFLVWADGIGATV